MDADGCMHEMDIDHYDDGSICLVVSCSLFIFLDGCRLYGLELAKRMRCGIVLGKEGKKEQQPDEMYKGYTF